MTIAQPHTRCEWFSRKRSGTSPRPLRLSVPSAFIVFFITCLATGCRCPGDEFKLSETRTSYSGNDLRFRVIGGFFRVKVAGTGIDISTVATGAATLADGTSGSYSVGGGPFQSMPGVRTAVSLGG